ncbi:WbqC family protein [Solemya velesiana gill symbiont]|uniref:WbqC-like protein n=1 Tax=Solemya velesiana gill symbiont TaxID=1918948 RepID=A0A1T2KSE2_9GAMM|nr:WbqC family protein [Solemya velesiana gill symbiont]OOZ35767.1 hypothetical protein BOW51_10440 [Solemya velesiana gill symbiont]
MRLSVMQPYFFPYFGYSQLIAASECFIVYDNIKYTKKGWINRNRILSNGKDLLFSIPLKKGSDSLQVAEREIANNFSSDKLLNQIKGSYSKAPYFAQTFHLVEQILSNKESNLFEFIHNSIVKTCEHLGIDTEIRVSSDVAINHGLKSQDKVIALCEAVGADTYINPIGGVDLYSRDEFSARGIELRFLKSQPFEYKQFNNKFVPWLSIVDVMMFNSLDTIHECIFINYELI